MEIYEKKACLSISMINKKGKKIIIFTQVNQKLQIMISNR